FANDAKYAMLDSLDLSLLSDPRPTITRDDGMESFWSWLCYSSENVSVGCANICEETDQNRDCFELYFMVENGGHEDDFDFEDHHLSEYRCGRYSDRWNNFLKSQRNVCFLGAYLQDIGPNWRLWVLYQVKTLSGTWGAKTADLVEAMKYYSEENGE